MRNRGWRRYRQDIKVIQRLKNLQCHHWRHFKDVNGIIIHNSIWIDLIGDSNAHDAKTLSTNSFRTRDKTKWGKKNGRQYFDTSSPWTRHKDKQRFEKELDRIGLKHLPTNLDLSDKLSYL